MPCLGRLASTDSSQMHLEAGVCVEENFVKAKTNLLSVVLVDREPGESTDQETELQLRMFPVQISVNAMINPHS